MMAANASGLPVLLLQAYNDGRSLVVFAPNGPSSVAEKLQILEALGLKYGFEIEFIDAALSVVLILCVLAWTVTTGLDQSST